MVSIELSSERIINVTIDLTVFTDQVISKTIYWFSDSYIIFWSNDCSIAKLSFQKKNGIITNTDFEQFKIRLNQDLIDFKTRSIVNQETKTIRELLLVKAFATTDEFDEQNLFDQQQF